MAASSGTSSPQGDGAPKRPVKALTLRIVAGLGSDEEVLAFYARELAPWLEQLPVEVSILEIEDATEDERRERLGE